MNLNIKDERFYFLWLSKFLGIGSNKVSEVLEYFKTPEAVFCADAEALAKSNLFTEQEVLKKNRVNCKKLLEALDYCDRNNIRVVTYFSDEYPLCLKYIESPPVVLFVRGSSIKDIFPAIAVVGTRKATELGKKAAFSLSAKLSLAGFTVVSGGALGVDKMAHLGALASGNKTVVVLGSGIDSNYLKSNKNLRKAAEKNGAVISEFMPKAPATKYTFPIRNRIISALCSGVAVIEAGPKSGALITASYAMEQGKEVFAVPGDINKEEYKGNNQLIKEGAIPITNLSDILSVYSGRFGDILNSNTVLTKKITSVLYSELEKEQKSKGKNQKVKAETFKGEVDLKSEEATSFKPPILSSVNCSENAKKILSAFSEKIMMSDLLSSRSGVMGAPFIAAVTELELKGYIKAVPVGRYELKI